ncbi:MAG: methyltransferase [Marmoricola sp.]
MSVEDPTADLRAALLDDVTLVRAVASGRRRGAQPRWRRVELRYVDLRAGRHLQVTSYDETQAHTANHADAAGVVEDLLAEGFANWHVDTSADTLQVRFTKKGRPLVHRSARAEAVEPERRHDRAKMRMLAPEHPLLRELGISDAEGRIKPTRQAKYRQVEEFVRTLDAALSDAGARLRVPTAADPLRVVDLGCGNAYLTFAAVALLEQRGIPAVVTGVDVKEQSRAHNADVAARLGWTERTRFVVGTIGEVELDPAPEVVLALHACDTATDDALARAVAWDAAVVLAAPCCHHDIARQLRDRPPPAPYDLLVRDGILRERAADTLTDALRAALLRARGYRVDVMEFVESRHTPRNTLLRAVRGGGGERAGEEYDELVTTWRLRPRLGELLGRRP